jgi:hypothetical protein
MAADGTIDEQDLERPHDLELGLGQRNDAIKGEE